MPDEKPASWWKPSLPAAIALALLGWCAGSIGWNHWKGGPKPPPGGAPQVASPEERLAAEVPRWLQPLPDAPDLRAPYYSGAVVLVDRAARRLDQDLLDPAIAARTPDEVRTVIAVEWGETEGPSYARPGAAPGDPQVVRMLGTALVTVVDLTAGLVVGRERILEKAPERLVVRDFVDGGRARSNRPYDE